MAWAKPGGSHLITLGELHLLGALSAEFGLALGHLRWLVELKTFPDDKKGLSKGFSFLSPASEQGSAGAQGVFPPHGPTRVLIHISICRDAQYIYTKTLHIHMYINVCAYAHVWHTCLNIKYMPYIYVYIWTYVWMREDTAPVCMSSSPELHEVDIGKCDELRTIRK